MSHERPKLHKAPLRKMDAIATGFILGWVVASIYGVKKKREQEAKHEENARKEMYFRILKMLVFGVEQPKKRSIFDKIFRRK